MDIRGFYDDDTDMNSVDTFFSVWICDIHRIL